MLDSASTHHCTETKFNAWADAACHKQPPQAPHADKIISVRAARLQDIWANPGRNAKCVRNEPWTNARRIHSALTNLGQTKIRKCVDTGGGGASSYKPVRRSPPCGFCYWPWELYQSSCSCLPRLSQGPSRHQNDDHVGKGTSSSILELCSSTPWLELQGQLAS